MRSSDDPLPLCAENSAVEFDDVAALEELRRLHARAHALSSNLAAVGSPYLGLQDFGGGGGLIWIKAHAPFVGLHTSAEDDPHLGVNVMNERIDQFCEILRVKLTSIDNNMQALKTKLDSKARTAEHDVQSHLDSVRKRIAEDHTKLAAAQADIKKWTEERKAVTDEKIAEWKAKLEKAKLKGRAEAAERYAAGAVVVASVAVDEAEQAALEAWLARKDADSAQGTQGS